MSSLALLQTRPTSASRFHSCVTYKSLNMKFTRHQEVDRAHVKSSLPPPAQCNTSCSSPRFIISLNVNFQDGWGEVGPQRPGQWARGKSTTSRTIHQWGADEGRGRTRHLRMAWCAGPGFAGFGTLVLLLIEHLYGRDSRAVIIISHLSTGGYHASCTSISWGTQW